MADYIEREVFRKQLSDRQITSVFFNYERRNELGLVIEMLDNTPVAAVALVRRARWEGPVKVDADHNGYKCSECDEYGVPYWRYCPNCGARMDGSL